MAYAYQPTYPVANRPNTATVINIAHVCRVLVDYYAKRKKALQGWSKAPDIYAAMLIGMETEILEWFYINYPDYDFLERNTQYVWSLISDYAAEAQRAMGNGSGLVINPTTGSPINLDFYRADFIVGEAGSLMLAGDAQLTIALPGFIRRSINVYSGGINMMIGDITQTVINPDVTYSPSFIVIDFNYSVQNGERYIIEGVRAVSGAISGGSGGGLGAPLPLQQGAFLSNDGSALTWENPFENYTSDSFEPDGITVVDTQLANHSYNLYQNIPAMTLLIEGVDYVPTLSGGFTILMVGFDANTQNSSFTALKKKAT